MGERDVIVYLGVDLQRLTCTNKLMELGFVCLNLFVKVYNPTNVHAFTNGSLKLVFLIVSLRPLNLFGTCYTNQHDFLNEYST